MKFGEFKELLLDRFPSVTEEQLRRYEAMEELYMDWNSKVNVISRKDIGGLYLHHVLHSLCIAAYLQEERPEIFERLSAGATVLDLGTGGGFPGIPLAVMFPSSEFTLCDSVGKKTLVAGSVAKTLGLQNVEVVNCRAESLPQTFDYVVSRAVTTLENFYPWVKDKFSGNIFYLKGGDIDVEIVRMMSAYDLRKGTVSQWSIQKWLKDEYFEGKYVIDIHKSL